MNEFVNPITCYLCNFENNIDKNIIVCCQDRKHLIISKLIYQFIQNLFDKWIDTKQMNTPPGTKTFPEEALDDIFNKYNYDHDDYASDIYDMFDRINDCF